MIRHGAHLRFCLLVDGDVRCLTAQTLQDRSTRSPWVLCRLEDGDRKRLLLSDKHCLDNESFDALGATEANTGKWTLGRDGQESQTVSNNVLNAQQLAMMGNIIAKAIGTGIHDPCCGKDWEANEDVESGMADKSTV